MEFYNIHTHSPDISSNHICIYNKDISDNSVIENTSYYSVGIHPWYIKKDNIDEQIDQFKSIVNQPQVLAIGEAGLDKLIQTDLSLQEKVFKEQIQIAEDIHKPVIIHCVKAWSELITIKKELRPKMPWIIHGFRGNRELAKQLLHQGFMLSFGQYFQEEALLECWSDHFFAETDDKTIDIETIYQQLASSLNIPIDLLALKLRENVKRIFFI